LRDIDWTVMATWKDRLLEIRALRAERKTRDRQVYAIQLQLRKDQAALAKQKKKETILPANPSHILELKNQLADNTGRLQQLNLELNALHSLPKKVAATEARLTFIEQQLRSLGAQIDEFKQTLAKLQHQPAVDQKAFDKQQKLLSTQIDTQKHLQQDYQKTADALDGLRQQATKADEDRSPLETTRTKLREEIASLTSKLQASLCATPQTSATAARASAVGERSYQEAKQQWQASRDAVDAAIAQLYVDVPPRALVSNLTDDVPFLFMPVRIETRFMTGGKSPELWLRIYPDDIAIHSHEEVLTDREVTEGEKYWRALWDATVAGGPQTEDTKKAAWTEMVTQFGAQRAAYVAGETRPTNWDQLAAEVEPVFPPHDVTKTSSWSRAPRTTVMPDKFVVMLYEGETLAYEVVGQQVPDELFVGPDPLEEDDAFVNVDDKLLFGEAFDWTSDFPKAVALGMGFKIPITPQQAVNGFSKVLVMGLSLSAGADDSKTALETLIDNHHYSPKGFSLVRQGTPTNNTDDSGSGYTKNDQFNDISYYTETGDPLFNAGDETDGRYLADALGIEYPPLQYVYNSDATDRREAIAMNTALYPATLGYYFDTLMQPVLSEAAQETLREFFLGRVSGRGPLSAIRIGNQPYGILLTSNFTQWQWSEQENQINPGFLYTLQQVLEKYSAIWLSLLGQLNYVGKLGTESDPAAVLMDVLGMQPGSASFAQRIGYSTDYLRNLDDFQYGGRYFNDMRQSFDSKNNVLNFLSSLGYNLTDAQGNLRVPQLLRILYQHYHTTLDANNLIDAVPLSEKDPIRYYDEAAKKNYLDWLAEAQSIDALEKQDFGTGVKAPNALLYLKLRRALLLQLHKASVNWFLHNNIDVTPTLEVANFYNIRPEISLTKWETMKAKVAVAVPGHSDNAKPVAEYLLTSGKNQTEAVYLNEIRAALKTLASLPTARLERCFTEHLDTCTYRLDSWQGAMFGVRLEHLRQPPLVGLREGEGNQREQRNKGIYLGAYGWVENLKPSPPRQLVRGGVPDKLMPTKGEALYEYRTNGGFVHAPSLNQASAAAVLRAGYLSDAQSSRPDRMSVNLSSERVRRALFILQGIRNGQTLEALLGYQFERGLHDAASADVNLIKLNEYIYDFRDKYPLEQHYLQQQGSDGPVESISPNSVVNGVKLAEASGDVPYGAIGAVTGASAAEQQAIRQEKDRLSDSLDAVKDLLQSESVYQLVQGNFDRAAAVVNALQESNIPPEIDIINTPRSRRFSFTQRVAVQFDILDPDDPASNPWSPIAMSPRARVEPGLNAWLGKMLGQPDTVYCLVSQLDANGNISGSEEVSIDKLALQPIDLVYLIGGELNTGAAQPGMENRTSASELESRIAWYYREKNILDDTVSVRIEFLQPADKQTLGKLLPYLRMLKAVITDARPLHAQDYDPPSKQSVADKTNPQGYLAAELLGRVREFQVTFTTFLTDLNNRSIDAVVPDKDGNDVHYFSLSAAFDALQTAHLTFADISFTFADGDALWLQSQLLAISALGLPDAFPRQRVLADEQRKALLLDQAMSVSHRMGAAAAAASALLTEASAATETTKQVELYLTAGKALMGDTFNLLPHFMYNNDADIQLSHNDRAQLLQHATNFLHMRYPAEEWLQSVAHVRTNLSRWDYILSLYEWFNADRLSLLPIQLPYRAGDSWLAVEFPTTDPLDPTKPFNIEHDTLSITIHGDAAFIPAAAQCGLLIDDWTEDIPTRNETTGIAFNYDQPNVTPPQALLLAVPPSLKGHWSWDDLVGILNDTLLRAKLRAVEPQLLDTLDKAEVGVLLPAILADFSQYDLSVALDYRLNIPFVYENAPVMVVMKTTPS
jgi:hypothetical protein